MSIEKQEAVNLISILESGAIEVRKAIRVIETDDQTGAQTTLSETFHRHVIPAGSDLVAEAQRVQGAVQYMRDVLAAIDGA